MFFSIFDTLAHCPLQKMMLIHVSTGNYESCPLHAHQHNFIKLLMLASLSENWCLGLVLTS